jgi:AcrR family transcriptional regulator
MEREFHDGLRKRPRQARARATVDVILGAAAHILESEGFEVATTNRIAERAGVSIGSLYQYFPDKHAVFAELRSRRSEWFDGCIRSEIERATGLALRDGICAMVRLSIALHAIDPKVHNELSERRALGRDDELSFRNLMQSRLEAMRDEVRPRNLELASFVTVRVAEALVHTTALDEPERLADPEFADEVSELLIRYLVR